MSLLESLFGGGARGLIGLDISSSSVKLLELARRGSQYAVESFALEPLPPGVVADKQIIDPAVVGQAVTRAVERAGTRTRQAAVAVAGSAVITKPIAMPAGLDDNALEEQIKAEADQYLPYPIDEVALDFQVAGAGRSAGDNATVEVLLAACRKEQVENRLAALEIAGLTPAVVDVEACALENACQFLRHQMPDGGRERTIAVVDMGASTTSVLVLLDGKPVYTRDQAFGGKQLTEDIMRYYDLSLPEAGKAKRSGTLPETYFSELLPHFFDDMSQQIDRSFQYYFASAAGGRQIDQVILAGGCAQIEGVEAQLQQRLQRPTVVARPLAQMAVASRARPQHLAKEEPSLLIALGLAFRAFDEES
ncbi:MAG: pilus assembly protein PilM [Gammaproteobacteria bacterium]|nr:pilus assembly protein PilM [Gammaproteobacteria bacterium]